MARGQGQALLKYNNMRIFVTHIVPRDKILEYNLSIAACNFSHNLIEGGAFDKTYSILPTFVKRKVCNFKGLIYSSLRTNRLLHKLAPIVENLKLFRLIPKGSSVWYYNSTILNTTLIVLLKLFKPSVRQNMIMLDYTPTTKPIECFYLWLANKMDGMIKLADSTLFTVQNSACLPGVVPDNSPQYPQIKEIKKEFLISGALGYNISMLPMLLEAFSKLPYMTLHITGNAPDMKLVESYTKQYKNIIYHGIVEYKEYLRILHDAPFLLSTRDPNRPENQCNFPSKIIEALLHNRIIVSTLHYNQLDGIRYLEVAADKESFKADLRRIAAMPDEELLTYANQAEETIRRYNVDRWNETMLQIEQSK